MADILNQQSHAKWDINKRCFVTVNGDGPFPSHLIDSPLANMDQAIIKLKKECVALAIKFIGTSDNSNRGFDVDKVAEKIFNFLIKNL